ncbi:T9SS type A sorting domain-containing protein [Calditrichota bacterium]
MNRLTTLLMLAMLLVVSHSGWSKTGSKFVHQPATKIVRDMGSISTPISDSNRNKHYSPRRDDIIGEVTQVGDTYYDYQSNGSINKFIAMDGSGNIHVTWMDAYYPDITDTRKQQYNYYSVETEGWLYEDYGLPVDDYYRSGYGNLWQSNDETSVAIVFSHFQASTEDPFQAFAAIDYRNGAGAFYPAAFPRFPGYYLSWSQGVLSPEDKLHAVANYFDADGVSNVSYVSGSADPDDGIEFDQEIPLEAGLSHLNSYRIARSPYSERAAIIWLSSRVGLICPDEWKANGEPTAVWQMNNDLWLAWTDNGEDWNFDKPKNVTKAWLPDPTQEDTLMMYGDTLLPFNNFDLIFDDDDNIHIVFQTLKLDWNPTSDAEPPVDDVEFDAGYLFHWSEETEEFSVVADGYYELHWIEGEGEEADTFFVTSSGWVTNVSYPSLAYGPEGELYCVYTRVQPGDFSTSVAKDGYDGTAHADIDVTVSEDNGATWYEPTPVVSTYSHLAERDEAESELYPTLAERVDDYLHILYLLDTEAGTVQQSEIGAASTLCPIMYLKVPTEDIARDELIDVDVAFHVDPWTDVTEAPGLTPYAFELTGAYPNPFNSRTSIEFQIRRAGKASLDVIDLSGRRVAQLLNGKLVAGRHTATWDAVDMPNGVYFVRLRADGKSATTKVALIK